MADNRKQGFPKCSTLFLSEDGSPMLFYMTPSAMKTKLRPLIHHGGGELSSKVLSDSIMLADPAVGGNVSGYLSTDYIFDSIKQNKLQDMEKYRLKSPSRGTVKTSKTQEKISPSTTKVSGPAGGGRHFYTHDEDVALILFVKENQAIYPIKGNSLYKEAAKAEVTTHSWQSMRDHYLKVLHKRRRNFDKLIFKPGKVKSAAVLKEKMLNGEAGQSRKTRSQRPSPSKKTVAGNKDSREQDAVSENLPDVTSGDNADDEKSAEEDVDYDKLFDDNLLRLAAESKAQKDRQKVDDEDTEKISASDENKVSSSQDAKNKKTVRRRTQKPMDQQEGLSDFDGEVSAREDLKRPSANEDEDNRPLTKRTKGSVPSKPDEKEPQMNEKIRTRYQELQLKIQGLASQWTVPKTIHALLVTLGKIDAAERYLQNGSAGKERWSVEEDKILLSKNKEAISCLAKTKGLQSVVDRMNFMEGII